MKKAKPKPLVIPTHFIHQATRYCMGRRSYAVGVMCDWLVANWWQIPVEERQIIRADLEGAIRRGGELGDKMDEREWSRVWGMCLMGEHEDES